MIKKKKKSLLDLSNDKDYLVNNLTQSTSMLTWYPKSFMNTKEFQLMPKYLQKGVHIKEIPNNKVNHFNNVSKQRIKNNWRERKKKILLYKLDYTKKYGSCRSFDRNDIQSKISKIQLELDIIDRNDEDGSVGDVDQHVDVTNQILHRTKPAYVKKMVYSQRKSLDSLTSQTKQTLELMELGLQPGVTNNDNIDLLSSVQRTINHSRRRSIAFMEQHLDEIQRKHNLFVDPAEFYAKKIQ